MRKSFGGTLMVSPEGKLVGASLGVDGCAEHEWGIGPLREQFGVTIEADDRSVLGIDRRKITRRPAGLEVLRGLVPIVSKPYSSGFRKGRCAVPRRPRARCTPRRLRRVHGV